MSRLKIYWPDYVPEAAASAAVEQAVIVPFQRAGATPGVSTLETRSSTAGNRMSAVLDRARVLHGNRCCPHCRHPVVEPIELQDATLNRARLPIPGTATLVGFRCDACRAEWPAKSSLP